MTAVNGFRVTTWADLAFARRQIHPVAPAEGPHPAETRVRRESGRDAGQGHREPAVTFGGVFKGMEDKPARPATAQGARPAALLDLLV